MLLLPHLLGIHKKGRPKLSNIQREGVISIHQPTDEKSSKIPQLPTTEAQRVLGVQNNPSMVTKTQGRICLETTTQFTHNLQTGKLMHQEMETVYKTILLPKLRYPLGILPLHITLCKEIDSKLSSPLLTSLGYPTTLDRRLVYATTDLLGIGIHNTYCNQGIKQFKLFICHMRKPKLNNGLMEENLKWAQLHAGTQYPILETVHTELPHLSDISWISSL
jgi:hypothetical protein